MKFEIILVRYGEIALKGKEVRRRFENNLINNIKNALEVKDIENKISREYGRIYIHTKEINKSVNVLKKIFGIVSISPSIKTKCDINSISRESKNFVKNILKKEDSFALRVKRTGKHDYSSQDIAIKVGEEIVNLTDSDVNLTKPDFELFIEIRDENAFIFSEKIKCAGGMPIGSQGKIISLVDSFESILATWYLMKRGCMPIFLIDKKFDENHLKSFQENWFFNSKIIKVDIKSNIFSDINRISQIENCKALVTSHSFSIEFNDLIEKIRTIKENVDIPVLSPLISIGKEEIRKKSKEIGLRI